jgi:hypothetical protein
LAVPKEQYETHKFLQHRPLLNQYCSLPLHLTTSVGIVSMSSFSEVPLVLDSSQL